MKRLRLYFALFFILLAVPIVILLSHTYSNLEQESFFLYRRTAESLMATVYQRLQENLQVEEQRPYTHYRYIHVADRAVPQQEGLNLSPWPTFRCNHQSRASWDISRLIRTAAFTVHSCPKENRKSPSPREANVKTRGTGWPLYWRGAALLLLPACRLNWTS